MFFALDAADIRDMPVMFPPGRARSGNDAGFDWVGRDDDDWDIPCCLFCRQCAGHIERYDHINLEPDQLGCKARKSIELSFRRAKLKCNVLPLDIAQFVQCFPKLFFEGLRICETDVEHAYSSYLSG